MINVLGLRTSGTPATEFVRNLQHSSDIDALRRAIDIYVHPAIQDSSRECARPGLRLHPVENAHTIVLDTEITL
jgi:hypothetical protein